MKILLLIAGDLILLYGSLFTGLAIRYSGKFSENLDNHAIPFSIVFFFWLLMFGAFGLYDFRFIKNSRIFYQRLMKAVTANLILAALIFYAFPTGIEPRRNLLLIAGFSLVYLLLWRMTFNFMAGKTRGSRIIFFGTSQETLALIDYLLANPQLGHRPVVCISGAPSARRETLPIPLHDFNKENLARVIQNLDADTIVIAPEMKRDQKLVEALFEILPLGVSIMEFPAYHEMITGKISLTLIQETWFLENLIGQARPRYEFLKRAMDILLGFAIGVIFLILLPLIAAGIILSRPSDLLYFKKRRARAGDGLIFFRQPRVGANCKVFEFIKFRSQMLGSEKLGEAKEITRDPRKYFFGTLLRKTYLDELPQVWNVLRGEMSFIGPRPERPEYVEELKKKVPFYAMRLLAPPGITGWAQVNMENDASVEDASEKMQYDLYYIKNRSFQLDLLIGLRTLFSILGRTGR